MKSRWMVLLSFVLAFSCLPPTFAQPFTAAQTEINYLLNFIEISGCAFYRNGSWYDSVEAQEHLRMKFDHLSARNHFETAEDFIEQAASKSSLSGRPYQVRCGSGASTMAGNWLKVVLTRYRIVAARETESP